MKNKHCFFMLFFLVSTICLSAFAPAPQAPDPGPPDEVVKLIFIHHSTGENWLTDGYGNLGRELGRNNYFVSDTNYSWGPNYIGDRTDIPNWIEWFRSGDTPTYMQALFNESGQHSSYTRDLSDPGGENQIIMFKSCFPNSALEGDPNDPPGTYEELTVSGAKYTYNELLRYFATRPDKLFVVITAPPLSDRSYAENARAFNLWLVNDWLRENNYTTGNVAVFDFYNVLTARNAHHRYENGQIEHVIGNRDTLHYPTGDDHPSEAGSQKATEEFIPLLNIFYNSWSANAPMQPPAQSSAPAEEEQQPAEQSQPAAPASGSQAAVSALIDNFETDNPAGTNGWEPFWDEATPTSMHCAADSGMASGGSRSLILDFDVAANSWATCALFYDSAQDWSGSEGLTFYLHSSQSGLIFDVDLYTGSGDTRETYLFTVEAQQAAADGWMPVSLYWSDFHRADWEANAGESFAKPMEISGVSFGLSTYPDTPNTGTLWVDDLALMGGGSAPAPQTAPQEQAQEVQQPEPQEPERRRSLPCGISFSMPVMLILTALWSVRRWF